MTARTETAAVVVVGCGPGGAVLAYLLARSGIDVALVERAATFEREYRGFGWNPGVVRLFDEMDLLDDVLALAHETVTEGSFSLYGEESTVLDFDLLDTDYPYALLMEQPALLDCLVDRANSSDNFTFHPATTVTDICTNTADGIRGVTARDRDADEDVEFKTQCVVGADGRYSTVRASAGIDPGLFESPIDLVWFKLPRGAINATTQGRIDRNGVLLYFGLGGGDLQIGYLIRSGEWPSIRQAGFDAFRERSQRSTRESAQPWLCSWMGFVIPVSSTLLRESRTVGVGTGFFSSVTPRTLQVPSVHRETRSPSRTPSSRTVFSSRNSLARTEFSNAKPSTNSRFDDVRTSNRLFRSSGAPRPISRTGSSTVAMSLHASFVG